MAVGDLVDLDENGEQTPSLIVVSPVAERVAPSAGAWTVAECPLQSLWQFVVAYQVPAGKTLGHNQTVGTVPPSMTYSVPVMDAARGDARNVTKSATSCGLAGRPRGMPPSESMSRL